MPDPLHDFPPTQGRVVGYAGLAAASAVAVYLLGFERSLGGARVGLAAAVLGVLIWAVLLRPRALVYPGTLLLRHALSDTEIPLRLVEDARVRQSLHVWAEGRRHVCTGIGRSTRSLLRDSSSDYEDFVAEQIRQLADDARRDTARVGAGAVRRRWAWPELTTLGLLGLGLLVSLVR